MAVAAPGWRAMPAVALPAGMPEPTPEPMAARPTESPAPSTAAQPGHSGWPDQSMNMSMKATTMPKIAGVWLTAEPMSMLVVRAPWVGGLSAMPRQASAAGKPPPAPEPMALRPLASPEASRAQASIMGAPLNVHEGQEHGDDQGEDARALGHRLADEHILEDGAAHGGVLADGPRGVARGEALAQGRAYGPEAHREAGPQEGRGLYPSFRAKGHEAIPTWSAPRYRPGSAW